jgi:hypothetical protein
VASGALLLGVMRKKEMIKVCALAAMVTGCAVPAASWKGEVKWPETQQDEQSVKTVIPPTEAGAALAAAAAIREMVRTNTDPRLFWGCSSPEQGMDVAVFTGPTPGLYYVVLEEHFNRCGGPRGRVLDWDYVYAVTPQGEVVEKAPPPRAEPLPAEPEPYRSSPPSPKPTPSPAVLLPDTGTGTPAPAPPPASPPPPAPAPTPAAVPAPASPLPPPPAAPG